MKEWLLRTGASIEIPLLVCCPWHSEAVPVRRAPMQRSGDPKPGHSKSGCNRKTSHKCLAKAIQVYSLFSSAPPKAQTAVPTSIQQRSLGFPLVRPAANSSKAHVLSFCSLQNHPLMVWTCLLTWTSVCQQLCKQTAS